MKFNVVNGSCLFSGRNRLFPIRYASDGTPCIIGTPKDEPNDDNVIIVVFKPTGGTTKTHPGKKSCEVYYEIHLGDFVGIVEHDMSMDCIVVYSYHIQFIDNDGLAHGVPARL